MQMLSPPAQVLTPSGQAKEQHSPAKEQEAPMGLQPTVGASTIEKSMTVPSVRGLSAKEMSGANASTGPGLSMDSSAAASAMSAATSFMAPSTDASRGVSTLIDSLPQAANVTAKVMAMASAPWARREIVAFTRSEVQG
jgi:hypothetical protein